MLIGSLLAEKLKEDFPLLLFNTFQLQSKHRNTLHRVFVRPGGSTTVSHVVWNDTNKSYELPNGSALADCKAYLNSSTYRHEGSGVYRINPTGSSAMNAYCDMGTDGGGWTMAVNYLHQGGTSPALVEKSTSLPLAGIGKLGVDESASATTWGHAIPSILDDFTIQSVRFNCITSNHTRVMHFKTSYAAHISYIQTGTGSSTYLNVNHTYLVGGNANLPGQNGHLTTNYGNNVLVNLFTYKWTVYHWRIGFSGAWECDDVPGNNSQNTLHRVFFR